MRSGPDLLDDPEHTRAQEWLITNGRGGFAAGTVAGAATRRSHGLLFAALAPPRPRFAALASLDERLQLHDAEALLAGGPAGLHGDPRSHPALARESFRLAPWPVWRMRAGEVLLEKSLFLIYGPDAVVVEYRLLEGPAARLLLTPLFTARDEDALQHENDEVGGVSQMIPGRVRFELYPDRPTVTLWHNAGGFVPARAWYRGLEYAAESAREDAFAPGHLQGMLAPGRALHVVASVEEELFRALAAEGRLGTPPASSLAECVRALQEEERVRDKLAAAAALTGVERTARQAAEAHAQAPGAADAGPGAPGGASPPAAGAAAPHVSPGAAGPSAGVELAEALVRAADAFVVRRAQGATLIAAYPGRGDRTLDALRALPGLLLAPCRFAEAREVLEVLLGFLDDGFLPEWLDEPAGPRAAPEATLWLVHACDLYVRRSEDADFLRAALLPALEGALQYFRAGTRAGVGLDRDGLLAVAGTPAAHRKAHAAAGETPAGEGSEPPGETTAAAPPRRKPVALNALWFHALAALSSMARRAGKPEHAAFYTAWAREHRRAFNELLWSDGRGYCYAALEGDLADETLDAGQVLAVSLPPMLLAPERGGSLLDAMEHELLTPLGLRSSASPRARGRAHQAAAEGKPKVRPRRRPRVRQVDAASPWLLAHFVAGHLRVHQRSPESQAKAQAWLEPLLLHVLETSQLPEAFSSAPPYQPLGAAAFAPGVAELLRVCAEELAWPALAGAGAQLGARP